MSVCTDVYTRPQTCTTISIYPSQVHPGGGGGRRPYGSWSEHVRLDPRTRKLDDDEAIALALLLLD